MSERYSISPRVMEQVSKTKRSGGKVVAVGTTTVRALESLARSDSDPVGGARETDLFLRPGDPFHIVDAMITNFHLPKSSLLMLVCAFAGTDKVMNAYYHAVRNRYRFFSYGDAMFLTARKTRVCT